MSQNSCCVPGCSVTRQHGGTLHKFPDPKKHPEKFKSWVSNIGGEVATLDHNTVNNRRVCEKHFLDVHKYPKNRLSKLAVPLKHLPGEPQTDSKDVQQTQTDSKNVQQTETDSSNVQQTQTDSKNAMSITDVQTQPICEAVPYVITYKSEQPMEAAATETILPSECNDLGTESYILVIGPENDAQDEPQLIESQDESQLIETQHEPQLIETQDEPQLIEFQDEPQIIETQNEPQLIETQDEPQLIETQDEPQFIQTQDESQVIEPQYESQVIETQNESQVIETQDEPQLIQTQAWSQFIETQDESQLMETQDWPQSDETQPQSGITRVHVKRYIVHKKEKTTNSKDPDSAIAQHKDYKALLKKLRKCEKEKILWKTKYHMARKMTKTQAFNLLTKHMSETAKLFFKMQVDQSRKQKRGRRFTLEEKILALALYKQSTASYHLLSKLCVLPCRRTLETLQQRILSSGNANT